MPNPIYLGSDHAGFTYKEKIKQYLDALGVPYEDLGNTKLEPHDDYPEYAAAVAKKVQSSGLNKGILVCGSGIGMCIAANRFKKVRAVNITTVAQAEQSRKHNNANVLCLGQSVVPFWIAKRIIKTWLNTPFAIESRHRRRVTQLDGL